MRIISKFHDYYDTALKEGIDNTTIYHRETSSIQLSAKESERFPDIRNGYYSSRFPANLDISLIYIGFCGSLYPAVQIEKKIKETIELNVFYSFEDFKSYCVEKSLPIDFNKKSNSIYFRSANNGKDYMSFFLQKETRSLDHLFFKYNIPVFIYKEGKGRDCEIVLSPNLKNISFYKIKDPYSAFQEIYMFISGVLKKPEKVILSVSDQDKIHKHGFDKWSFRKKGT